MSGLSYKIGDDIVVGYKKVAWDPAVKVTGKVVGFIVDVRGKGLSGVQYSGGGGGSSIDYLMTGGVPRMDIAQGILEGGRRKRRMTRRRR